MSDDAAQKWCGRCQGHYDAQWDSCPMCGAIETQAHKHMSEIRNLIALMIVFQAVAMFMSFVR